MKTFSTFHDGGETVWKEYLCYCNFSQIPKMAEEKKVKRGDFEFLYSKNMVVCEWADSCSVLVFSNALEDMNYLSSVKSNITMERMR